MRLSQITDASKKEGNTIHSCFQRINDNKNSKQGVLSQKEGDNAPIVPVGNSIVSDDAIAVIKSETGGTPVANLESSNRDCEATPLSARPSTAPSPTISSPTVSVSSIASTSVPTFITSPSRHLAKISCLTCPVCEFPRPECGDNVEEMSKHVDECLNRRAIRELLASDRYSTELLVVRERVSAIERGVCVRVCGAMGLLARLCLRV